MNIKNYTSSVPADRTISRIEQLLANAGATAIMKDYRGGIVQALCFNYTVNGNSVVIRLPANVEAIYKAMVERLIRKTPSTLQNAKEQALRTSWKLMQDWVEVQLSLTQMRQADFIEVFLPYVWDGSQTFYESIKSSHFKALPPPPSQ